MAYTRFGDDGGRARYALLLCFSLSLGAYMCLSLVLDPYFDAPIFVAAHALLVVGVVALLGALTVGLFAYRRASAYAYEHARGTLGASQSLFLDDALEDEEDEEEDEEDDVVEEEDDEQWTCLVARASEGRVVGVLVLEHANGVVHVLDVTRDARRRGVGRQLLARAATRQRSLGVLLNGHQAIRSMRFFEGAGFRARKVLAPSLDETLVADTSNVDFNRLTNQYASAAYIFMAR